MVNQYITTKVAPIIKEKQLEVRKVDFNLSLVVL